jgi:hypothetical protein
MPALDAGDLVARLAAWRWLAVDAVWESTKHA